MKNLVIDTENLQKIDIKPAEIQKKTLNGDLFFNGSSETPEELGMCSILLNEIEDLFLNSFCFGFRLNRELKTNGIWLCYYFRSNFGRELLYSLAQGAIRYNLSKTNFLKLEIFYPDPEEQTAIAQILSDMDKEIKLLEERVVKTRSIKTGMMQELLTGKTRLLSKEELNKVAV